MPIYNPYITRIGGPVLSGTTGSVLFVDSSGNLAQNNTNFFWDNTNNRLGIGTTGPTNPLEVVKTSAGAETLPLALSNKSNIIATAVGMVFSAHATGAVTQKIVGLIDGTGLYPLAFYTFGTSLTEKMRIDGNGNVGIGTTGPTAVLHLKAGVAAANGAPFKLTSGINLTTAENGAMEYNGTNLFFTRTGAVREGVITESAVNVVSPTAPNRTITVNIDGTTYYIAAKTTND